LILSVIGIVKNIFLKKSPVKGMGVKDAEKVRNIVLAWLAEKSFIKKHSEK